MCALVRLTAGMSRLRDSKFITVPTPPHPAACIWAIFCNCGKPVAFSPSARSWTITQLVCPVRS